MATATLFHATDDNRSDWDIDPVLYAETDAILTKLHEVTGEVGDLNGPSGHMHYDGENPVPDDKRHECSLDLAYLEPIKIDCRGNVPTAIAAGLREHAERLVELAEAVEAHG